MGFLIRVLVNAVTLWITTRIVTELSFGPDDDLAGIIQVAIVFGLVNAFIRPVLKLLTFPLSLLTFGLFGLLVNGLLLLIGLSALGCGYLIVGFSTSKWMLLLARIVQGAGGGTTGVTQAYVTDTVQPHALGLKFAIEFYGLDHVMYGDDYPCWNAPAALEIFQEMGLSQADQQKILSDNARRILGLKEPAREAVAA